MTDPVRAALEPLLAGTYAIERELGRGGMGVVYLARETRLDRPVAIKVLPPHLTGDATIRERFLREARTAAQLSHPHIVPIYRAEEANCCAYFVMAFIEGENLAERVRDRGPLPPAEVVRLLRESAWALAYAHLRGVVHRDIKAANIMIERGSGRAVLTDFGIARDSHASSLTQAGEVVGTVHYMSPEQANGLPLDGRSDLYSLGVAGFQALSGRLPFEGDNPAAVLLAVSSRTAPSLGAVAPQVPAPLVEVIDRCLRKEPDERYPTGEALAEALELALERSATRTGPGEPDRVIATSQAEAIWLRAAQLQAEAATRLEQRSRDGTGLTTITSALPTGGYRLRDVEAAAKEVGIAPEFVALALAEQPVAASMPAAATGSWKDRMTTRLLGTSERSISVSRVIRGSPRTVLEAVGRIFPGRPYLLGLRDTVGGHPLDGGVLVFSVPNMMKTMVAGSTEMYTPFTYRMYQLELFQLNVTLRPLPGGGGCEVTIYGDLRSGLKKNLQADQWIAGTLGTAGAVVGTAAGISALALGTLAFLPGIAGAATLGAASLAWYRWLYRYALRKGTEELEGMLSALEAYLRSAQVFGSVTFPEPPPPRPPGDDGGAGAVVILSG
ncbi:MAG: protein kinase [Gemmatimonadetes bacterium]|nr:protein kinase [Gemmatimonadota bacterium]